MAEVFTIRYIKITTNYQLQIYNLRQQWTLSALPQLLIICQKGNIITLQIQQAAGALTKHLNNYFNQHMAILYLSDILISCTFLRQQFGCFALSDNHLKIGMNGKPKVWIHQNYLCNFPQLPLPNSSSGQKAMIKSILALFKVYTKSYKNLIKLETFYELNKEVLLILNNTKQRIRLELNYSISPKFKYDISRQVDIQDKIKRRGLLKLNLVKFNSNKLIKEEKQEDKKNAKSHKNSLQKQYIQNPLMEQQQEKSLFSNINSKQNWNDRQNKKQTLSYLNQAINAMKSSMEQQDSNGSSICKVRKPNDATLQAQFNNLFPQDSIDADSVDTLPIELQKQFDRIFN